MTRAAATEIAVEHVIYWRALRDYTVRQAGDALGVRFSKPGWDVVSCAGSSRMPRNEGEAEGCLEMADRSLESYAHRAAKSLLIGWLRSAASAAGIDEYANFAGVSWRVNRGGPHFGIWDEYPVIANNVGLDPVWDEADPRWRTRPPSYDEVVGIGWRPMAIIDIAIQHKGQIAFGIEVRHKHPCDARKVGFLGDKLTLIEIPAYWVLGQVGVPSAMPPDFFLS